jgi:hypothetical protein
MGFEDRRRPQSFRERDRARDERDDRPRRVAREDRSPPSWVLDVHARLEQLDEARAALTEARKELDRAMRTQLSADCFEQFSKEGGITATDWEEYTRCHDRDYDGKFGFKKRRKVVVRGNLRLVRIQTPRVMPKRR